ncbi:MAG TPA: AGE family epimerase/isomerase [Pyrinomonadaceae bacterium]|nr:AGE family epimerase/isomerase [Pyrinomonadaceae bacterium]
MRASAEKTAGLRRRIEGEWRDNIAPFWVRHAPDEKHGGFRGLISDDLRADEQADKGVILNSRILWTFSRAYGLHSYASSLALAARAYLYLTRNFLDREHGGVFWTLDYTGRPADTKKRPYAQAFALYALTEFYLATGERAALDEAVGLFDLLEARCRDREYDGYFETFERDWSLAVDQRLSEVDQDEKKSMNTHLHVLEAYSALAHASRDERVRERLSALVHLFLTRIVHPRDSYLMMFFDETWACKSARRSFGHDIEASWLLCEAAEVLGDRGLAARVREVALKMAQSVYEHGLDAGGRGLLYEADAQQGVTDADKHWWAQAEAVVGFVNAYQLSGGDHFLEAAARVWEFIDGHVVDRERGEWFWKTSREGVPSRGLPKLSQWKCPYHNGRMCFEISRRLASGAEKSVHGSHGI